MRMSIYAGPKEKKLKSKFQIRSVQESGISNWVCKGTNYWRSCMNDWKKCFVVIIWLYVYTKKVKASSGCEVKNRKP
jgi:hypothetical protein